MFENIKLVQKRLLSYNPSSASYHKTNQQIVDQLTTLANNMIEEIDFLEQRIRQLEVKVNCFAQDNNILIKENSELKKKLQRFQLNQTLQFQEFYNKYNHSSHQISPLFQKVQEDQSQLLLFEPNSSEHQKTEYELINCISGQKMENNMKGSVQKTPILHQPIFKDKIYRTKYNIKGLIRAFYIKLLTYPQYLIKLIELIETDYQNGEEQGLYLFSKYPDNQFIANMVFQFLKNVNDMKKYCQVLQYLNSFQLFDDIFIQIFINKLQVFVDIPSQLDQRQTKKCFTSLGNVFDLEVVIKDRQVCFFEECNWRIPSQGSQSKYNVYEQISLNPKPPKDSISYIQKQNKAPLFTINIYPDLEYFQFNVREQKQIGDLLEHEDLILSESLQRQNPKAFNESGSSQLQFSNKKLHFVDVPSILSQSEKAVSPNLQSSIDVMEVAKKRYINLHRGSKQSILLSGYSENKWSQQAFRFKELFKSLKQRGTKSPHASEKKKKSKHKSHKSHLANLQEQVLIVEEFDI